MSETTLHRQLARLIEAMAGGDQTALTGFYDSTSRQAYGLILRILKDPALADEVTMDVYMQVWREAGEYTTDRGSPAGWLMTIARSRAIDRVRVLRKERQRMDAEPPGEEIADLTPLPDDQSIENERAHRVKAALAQLSPEQRQVLLLSYFRGLSHSEIAEHLSMPLGTVKTHIRTGMVRLKLILLRQHRQSEL